MDCVFMEIFVTHAEHIQSRGQLNFFTNHQSDLSDLVFVFFTDEKSVGIKTMRKYAFSLAKCNYCCLLFCSRLLGILEEKSINRGIIVYPATMTPSARKVSEINCVYLGFSCIL